MHVTLPSVGMILLWQPKINVFVAVSIKQLSTLWYFSFLLSTTIFIKPLQPENADLPMLVTESGIVILVKPLQPENAESPMLVTESGIVRLVKLLQPSNAEL